MAPRSRRLLRKVWLWSSVVFWPVAALAGPDWPMYRGDRVASQRAEGWSELSGTTGEYPGIRWSVPIYGPGLSQARTSARWVDTDGDGTDELLVYYINQGRVRAWNASDAQLAWESEALGITDLAAIFDGVYDPGTGPVPLVVAVAYPTGGGIFLFDGRSGALLWRGVDWPEGAGIRIQEMAHATGPGDSGTPQLMFNLYAGGVRDTYWIDLADLSDLGAGNRDEVAVHTSITNSGWGIDALSHDLDGDGRPEFLFTARDLTDIFYPCSSDEGGVCNRNGVCLCRATYTNPTSNWTSASYVVDLEGDGAVELVRFGLSQSYEVGFSRADLAKTPGNPPVMSPTWAYDYGDATQMSGIVSTRVHPARGGPVDLDGDGTLEIVASFYDDRTTETDLNGAATDDRINLPNEWVLGVFDANGLNRGTLERVYAYGTADLNGNGVPEIVARRTSGTNINGALLGVEADCSSGPCALGIVWEITGLSVLTYQPHPPPASRAELNLDYRAALALVDLQGDGSQALFVLRGSTIRLLEADGNGGVTETDLPHDSTCNRVSDIVGTGPDTLVVLDGKTCAQVLDSDLQPIGAPLAEVDPQGAPWPYAVQFHPDQAASLVVDTRVYLPTTDTTQPDLLCTLAGHFAFAADLDQDGIKEAVTFASGQGYPIRIEDIDPDTATCEVRWEYDGADHTDYTVQRFLLAFGDVDPSSPGLELMFGGERYGDWASDDIIFGALPPLARTGSTAQNTPLWTVFATTGSRFQYGAGRMIVQDFDANPANGEEFLVPFNDNTEMYRQDTRLKRWSNTHQAGNMAGDFLGDGLLDHVMIATDGRDPAPIYLWNLFDDAGELLADRVWTQNLDAFSTRNRYGSFLALDINGDLAEDILTVNAQGALDALDGTTGALLPHFPVYLKDGAAFTERPEGTRAATTIMAVDLNGDGVHELLVGSEDGMIYALETPGDAPPAVIWTRQMGTPITHLAAADMDGDGALELIVSADDGAVHVVDATPSSIQILSPPPNACLDSPTVTVTGTTRWIDEIWLRLAGGVPTILSPRPVQLATFSADLELPSVGTFTITADGLHEGRFEATDSVTVTYNVDEDGDGFLGCDLDCAPTDPTVYSGADEICDGIDNDCDDLVDEDSDQDEDGFTTCDGDCLDSDPTVYTGADEICDGIDNDCDSTVDEDAVDSTSFYVDTDQDGFGNPAYATEACSAPTGYVARSDDCDDTSASVYPGADEVCDDGIDQDCNGHDLGCDAVDDDQDGFTELDGDCDDADSSVYPGAQEICNEKDDDCDGVTDGVDEDRDGAVAEACGGTDCDDQNPDIHPGAEELCDGSDNDCNGDIDDRDSDSDGAIDIACGGADCDDTRPLVSPYEEEICDGIDNDCDGLVDEDLVDQDQDGYPDAACGGTDCNDSDPSVHPDADEIPGDGVDNDCDGSVDEFIPTPTPAPIATPTPLPDLTPTPATSATPSPAPLVTPTAAPEPSATPAGSPTPPTDEPADTSPTAVPDEDVGDGCNCRQGPDQNSARRGGGSLVLLAAGVWRLFRRRHGHGPSMR